RGRAPWMVPRKRRRHSWQRTDRRHGWRNRQRAGCKARGRARVATACSGHLLRDDRLVGLHLLEEVLGVVDLLGVEEAVQLTNTRRVTHFAQGLGLDLTDTFASDLKLFADLFE